MTMNSGPGYAKKPEHEVRVVPTDVRVRVTFGGEVVADTRAALLMHESGHDPVYYLPRQDVHLARLTRTDHETYCSFKGKASYWTIAAGGRTAENAVWSYETPYDEVLAIKEHMAFYPTRVDAIDVGE